MECIKLRLCVQIICWCSTSPSTCGLFWDMEDIIALKHTFPNFKKQARVRNKEQVRTAVSFKAMFFRHDFRFLLLLFRIEHVALPKGTLSSALLIPPIFLGYCYISFLCIHCCCCPAVQSQRKFLHRTHL